MNYYLVEGALQYVLGNTTGINSAAGT